MVAPTLGHAVVSSSLPFLPSTEPRPQNLQKCVCSLNIWLVTSIFSVLVLRLEKNNICLEQVKSPVI